MKAYFLSLKKDTPHSGFWDYAILDYLLDGFEKKEVRRLTKDNTAVVVIPARSHFDIIEKINKELAKIDNVVLFLMGDEEHQFPVEEIKHNNIKIWVQNPKMRRHDNYRKLGTGWTPHTKKPDSSEKNIGWFFAGQITHERRDQMAKAVEYKNNGEFIRTRSFTAGIPPQDYIHKMAQAKVAPCPSGPETPDTFRLFEALELGVVPIVEEETPKEKMPGFWNWLFDELVPFPILDNYQQLSGYIEDSIANYPQINNKVLAWWLRYKQKMKQWLYDDLGMVIDKKISVIIQTSYIKSHPDTSIIDETINSVLHHLSNVEIIITFDGVREEQADKEKDYQEYIRRVLWRWGDKITPYIFDEHKHQSGMLKYIFEDKIKSSLILYFEHDTPLVVDYKIDFEKLGQKIIDGKSDLIRFHFEAKVPDVHKTLMIGEPKDNLLKTIQWSQRPHLASAAFYRRILKENFSQESKCFIEDLMHGVVQSAYYRDGLLGWRQYKLHIYHPKGNIKRSYHTDGRAGANKYDDTQIF